MTFEQVMREIAISLYHCQKSTAFRCAIFAGVATLSGCTSVEDFKNLCRQTAKVEIINKETWAEYVGSLKRHYKRNGLSLDSIRIEPVDGYRFESTVSNLSINDIPKDKPVKNRISIKRNGIVFAVVDSYYISMSGFDGPSPFECATNYSQFYEEFQREVKNAR